MTRKPKDPDAAAAIDAADKPARKVSADTVNMREWIKARREHGNLKARLERIDVLRGEIQNKFDAAQVRMDAAHKAVMGGSVGP